MLYDKKKGFDYDILYLIGDLCQKYYHREGIISDYDDFDDIEELIQ